MDDIGAVTKPRMLVVDDELVITFALLSYFSDSGFLVCTASERDEALELLSFQEFDVVIADLRLTGSTGSEGRDVVRFARERSDRTVIVLLTAYGSSEAANEALDSGADIMLQKPQSLPELAATIRRLLEGKPRFHAGRAEAHSGTPASRARAATFSDAETMPSPFVAIAKEIQ